MSLICGHQCGDCGLLYECHRKYCSRPYFCLYLHDCRKLLYSTLTRRESLNMINPKKALVYRIIAITVVVITVTMYTALFKSPSDISLAIKSSIQPIANSNNPSIEQFKNQFSGLSSNQILITT